MPLPDTLRHRLDLYRSTGRVFREGYELFSEVAWLQVLEGQGIHATACHPLALLPEEHVVQDYLRGVRELIARCAAVMPTHEEFVRRHCLASEAMT